MKLKYSLFKVGERFKSIIKFYHFTKGKVYTIGMDNVGDIGMIDDNGRVRNAICNTDWLIYFKRVDNINCDKIVVL